MRQDSRWLNPGQCLPVVLLGSMVLLGCDREADHTQSTGVQVKERSTADETALGYTLISTRSWNLRDEFAAIAERTPGGFGGLFVNEQGRLAVVLKDPARTADARASLAQEPFIQLRQQNDVTGRFDPMTAEFRRGKYSYDELYAWYRVLLGSLQLTPRSSSILVRENRISIGVGDDNEVEKVQTSAASLGVPAEAIVIRVEPGAIIMARPKQSPTLRSFVDPLRAALSILVDELDAPCTLGPLVIRNTPSPQDGFLVASHCTTYGMGAPIGTTYWQPYETTPFEWHRIGHEAIDPEPWDQFEAWCPNSSYGCRNSDAAFSLIDNGYLWPYAIGTVARTASRNQDDITLSGYFTFAGLARHWSLEGDTLEKVGRTTGWSGGVVDDACRDQAPVNSYGQVSGPTILCSILVAARSGSGDSGSPVFHILSGSDIQLRGTLWGGFPSDTEECDADVVNGELVAVCPRFLASSWGGIVEDLDPYNNANLLYLPPN